MRKTCLISACSLALMLVPAASAGAVCVAPASIEIHQSNGYTVGVELRGLNRRAVAYRRGVANLNSQDVTLNNWSRALVKFTIVWNAGSAGVYEGHFDDLGFLAGTTYDRFHPRSRATWTLENPTRFPGCGV